MGAGIGRRSCEGWGCTGPRPPASYGVVRGNQSMITRIFARIYATGSTRGARMNVSTGCALWGRPKTAPQRASWRYGIITVPSNFDLTNSLKSSIRF